MSARKLKVKLKKEFAESDKSDDDELKVINFKNGTTVSFILSETKNYKKFAFKIYDSEGKLVTNDRINYK